MTDKELKNRIKRKLQNELKVMSWTIDDQIQTLKDAEQFFSDLDQYELCQVFQKCINNKTKIAEGRITDQKKIFKIDFMFSILINEYFSEYIDFVLEKEKMLYN